MYTRCFIVKFHKSFTCFRRRLARVTADRLKTDTIRSRDPRSWRRFNGHGSTEGGATWQIYQTAGFDWAASANKTVRLRVCVCVCVYVRAYMCVCVCVCVLMDV